MNDPYQSSVQWLRSRWPNILHLEISADIRWVMNDPHQSFVQRLWSLGQNVITWRFLLKLAALWIILIRDVFNDCAYLHQISSTWRFLLMLDRKWMFLTKVLCNHYDRFDQMSFTERFFWCWMGNEWFAGEFCSAIVITLTKCPALRDFCWC